MSTICTKNDFLRKHQASVEKCTITVLCLSRFWCTENKNYREMWGFGPQFSLTHQYTRVHQICKKLSCKIPLNEFGTISLTIFIINTP